MWPDRTTRTPEAVRAISLMYQSQRRTMDTYSADPPRGAPFGRIAVIVCRSTG